MNQQQSNKFNIDDEVPAREAMGASDTSSDSSDSSSDSVSASDASSDEGMPATYGDAFNLLRGSVTGVLESVAREYEPQIAQFTANLAHTAVDRGVDFAQTAVKRVRAQSWARIGLAAALGIGIIAVLGYEAEQAATAPRSRKNTH